MTRALLALGAAFAVAGCSTLPPPRPTPPTFRPPCDLGCRVQLQPVNLA